MLDFSKLNKEKVYFVACVCQDVDNPIGFTASLTGFGPDGSREFGDVIYLMTLTDALSALRHAKAEWPLRTYFIMKAVQP